MLPHVKLNYKKELIINIILIIYREAFSVRQEFYKHIFTLTKSVYILELKTIYDKIILIKE